MSGWPKAPRAVAAFAFGSATALVTHFAWYPDARMNGLVPALTLAAGLAHAVGGAITGARLLDRERTRTAGQAARLGAATSLLALVLFAPGMAAFVASSDPRPEGLLSYLVLTLWTGVFAFLAVGWALLLVSIAVGVILQRLVRTLSAAA